MSHDLNGSTNVLAASDAAVAPYADSYFEYDSDHRVTRRRVAGDGSNQNNGAGQGDYRYSYSFDPKSDNSTPTAPDYSGWRVKTTELLLSQDGSGYAQSAYTNAAGEIMLSDLQRTPNQWLSFTAYDSRGRIVETAGAAAVTGFNEMSPNLGVTTTGAGPITDLTYVSHPTLMDDGFLATTAIRDGQQGTDIPESAFTYDPRTAQIGGVAVFNVPVSTSTVYGGEGGADPQVSTYLNSPLGSVAIQQTTITEPAVGTNQDDPDRGMPQPVEMTVYDTYGYATWTKDAQGFINYTDYQPETGAVRRQITDANTVDQTLASDFNDTIPAGWATPSDGGTHRRTDTTNDELGRPTKVMADDNEVTYTVYKDTNHEVRTYPGWDTTLNSNNGGPTGLTSVSREDWALGYDETLTMSVAPSVSGGVPTGQEPPSGLESLSRTLIDKAGQVIEQDAYVDFTGVNYGTAPQLGAPDTNYDPTATDYDGAGRANREVDPDGTITRTLFDGLGRETSTWVGTNDAVTGIFSPSNHGQMGEVSANVYDNGGVGDGNLTKTTDFTGNAPDARVTQNAYDWRDRLVMTKEGDQGTGEDHNTHRPIVYYHYDNQDRVFETDRYDGDGIFLTNLGAYNGVPNPPSSSLLRARTTTEYDDQGRVYGMHVFSVDASNGSVSSASLDTWTWYDRRGNVIKTVAPGGLVTKKTYDGDGRVTAVFTTDGSGDHAPGSTQSWTDAIAGNVNGNVVLEQTNYSYGKFIDPNSKLIADETITRQRNHDATGTGDLSTGGGPARTYYSATYYDNGGRTIASVDVGTNQGNAWTPPTSVPSGSDTVLVTGTVYIDLLNEAVTTDPRGVRTLTAYDGAGRTAETIENWDGTGTATPTDSANKTTKYTYDNAGQVQTVTLLLPGVPQNQQKTQYFYGVSPLNGSAITSNDLLRAVQHPDPTTGLPSSAYQELYTYNDQGQTATYKDQNGTTHTYSYDVLGRKTLDDVTQFGNNNIDPNVKSLATAYDGQGNPYLFTSFDAGGGVVNQVLDQFNGLGQLTAEYQSHSGAVNLANTPAVHYAYSEMASGNNSRLVSTTYPNSRVVTTAYGPSGLLDDRISRVDGVADASGTLESYQYLGLGTVVQRNRPQPGANLTYAKLPGEPTGDAGDQYTGLDRFGRVVDQRWTTAGGAATDRFAYGYDRDSNRLYRDNRVNPAFGELYHANGPAGGYDNLNQLTGFARGTLSDTNGDGVPDTVANPAATQSWTLDAAGNMKGVTSDGFAAARTYDRQNALTAYAGGSSGRDANGNLTGLTGSLATPVGGA
jgi:YD repeat-containing protein